MVQRRCARYVMQDFRRTSSVTAMLHKLQWQSLQQRRAQSRIIFLHRVIYNLVDIPVVNYLSPLYTTSRGHDMRFVIPSSNIQSHAYSFFPRTIRTWNNLPASLVHSNQVVVLRSSLAGLDLINI